MKKLVLILVSALIIFTFIALNYLIWEKENMDKDIENLKYLNLNSNSRINAYERDIKNLEEQLKLLKEELSKQEENNKLLEEDKLQLEKEIAHYTEVLEQKNVTIDALARIVNIKELEVPIRKWVEAIDTGEYNEAYKLQSKKLIEKENMRNPDDLAKKYKNSVKSMKIKDIKFVTEEIPENKMGNIIFNVEIDVEKNQNVQGNSVFSNGSNSVFFTVDYDAERECWVISDISNSL
ncbi:MAG TPA: hypothetical protein GXX36_09240 [Clostridiaceae bacterium]|nr:hypothetical protein [Clostridiaceae bacterium]